MNRSVKWAIVTAAVLSSCTCKKAEKPVLSIDGGAIEAHVVRIDKKVLTIGGAGGGHVGILYPTTAQVTDCELRITKPISLDVPVMTWCEGTVLVTDDAGMRLAFGEKSGPKRVIYFGGADRSFSAPKTYDEPFDWKNVPSLHDALPAIFRAALDEEAGTLNLRYSGVKPPREHFGESVLIETKALRGDAGLEKMLLETRDAHFEADVVEKGKVVYRPLWDRAVAMLPADGRARIASTLVADIAKPHPSIIVLARALHDGDFSAATHDAMLFARLDELIDPKGDAGAGPPGLDGDVIDVLLRRLAQTSPEKTSKIACKLMAKDDRRNEAPILVLAATKASCPAFDAVLDRELEKPEMLCAEPTWYCPPSSKFYIDRRRCDRAELERVLRDRAALPWPALRKMIGDSPVEHDSTVVLALATRAKPLPAELSRVLDRQGYKFTVPHSAKQCEYPEAKSGEMCNPNWARISVQGCEDKSPIEIDSFRIVFDDAKKERWVEKK
jgi:hypothetical protein